jgi:hypothetical protein
MKAYVYLRQYFAVYKISKRNAVSLSNLRDKCKEYDRARGVKETVRAINRSDNWGKKPKASQCCLYVHS